MAHVGSSFNTAANVFVASGNQYEWSIATPRSKSGCTLGSQDVGKVTLPTITFWSASSWATEGAASASRETSRKDFFIAVFLVAGPGKGNAILRPWQLTS